MVTRLFISQFIYTWNQTILSVNVKKIENIKWERHNWKTF